MVDAEIFRHRGVNRQAVAFDTLLLRFAEDNRWPGAMWEFALGGGITVHPAEPIDEITAIAGTFAVTIIDGQGGRTGPLVVQSAMCGYPAHSFCFLFSVAHDGLWTGHTVARSFGHIAVVPYRFDPS